MARLSVKVDYVSALRRVGGGRSPDPAQAAVLAELAGADGISCFLREDRKFIRDRDIYIIKELVRSGFILQIAPVDDLIERALEVKPQMITLMPFVGENNNIKKGADLENRFDSYADAASRFDVAGIDVCCFLDPETDMIKNAAREKIKTVELNTHDYAQAVSKPDITDELDRLEQAAQFAAKLGMTVNCGGWLDYKNIGPLIDSELYDWITVGFSIASKAMLVGYDRAVREMANAFKHHAADF
jgi:pyridoxine 5-phosphate synthase